MIAVKQQQLNKKDSNYPFDPDIYDQTIENNILFGLVICEVHFGGVFIILIAEKYSQYYYSDR